jgi:hypothetical protein
MDDTVSIYMVYIVQEKKRLGVRGGVFSLQTYSIPSGSPR